MAPHCFQRLKGLPLSILATALGLVSGCGLVAPTTYNEGVELVVRLENRRDPIAPLNVEVQIGGPGEFAALTPYIVVGKYRIASYGRRPIGSSATFFTSSGLGVTCTLGKGYNHRTATVYHQADALSCVGW
jgi:hypothetical protein